MLRYLLFRLLSSVPALLLGVIALFIFRLMPTESVWEEKIELLAIEGGQYNHERVEEAKRRIREQLGLDLPVFYVSMVSAAIPRRWPEGFSAEQKSWVSRLSVETGRPAQAVDLAKLLAGQGFTGWVVPAGGQVLDAIKNWLSAQAADARQEALPLVNTIETGASPARAYLPAVYWNGKQNQFHLWISQLLAGDLGISWRNHEPVGEVIGRALTNTVFFTAPAFVLLFVTAYWLVVWMSGFGPRAKMISNQLLYFFNLVPLFGWALLAMILFASGSVFSWFPSHVSASSLGGYSFWSGRVWPYILPACILWVSSSPFVTRHIQNAFEKTADHPFVFMAYARGLPEHTIRRKYRLRYSLLPAITLFGEYLMAIISGALVVEVLFSIHGIGKLLSDSVTTQDYPVITGVVLVLIVARMLSYLAADLMYYWFDPRIRVSANE